MNTTTPPLVGRDGLGGTAGPRPRARTVAAGGGDRPAAVPRASAARAPRAARPADAVGRPGLRRAAAVVVSRSRARAWRSARICAPVDGLFRGGVAAPARTRLLLRVRAPRQAPWSSDALFGVALRLGAALLGRRERRRGRAEAPRRRRRRPRHPRGGASEVLGEATTRARRTASADLGLEIRSTLLLLLRIVLDDERVSSSSATPRRPRQASRAKFTNSGAKGRSTSTYSTRGRGRRAARRARAIAPNSAAVHSASASPPIERACP